jgi:hypothetical protein
MEAGKMKKQEPPRAGEYAAFEPSHFDSVSDFGFRISDFPTLVAHFALRSHR